MHALASSELMDLCDRGEPTSPAARSLLLLEATVNDDIIVPIREWPLGQVNAGLLRLRAMVFSRRLEVLADCPRCAAVCESELDCLAMADVATKASPGPYRLIFGETEIAYRLPTAADLLAVARDHGGDPLQALLQRIAPDQEVAGDGAELTGALAEAVAEADPLAQIELTLTCPDCAACWTEPLHVIDLFWAELQSLTMRLVLDVAQLAQAFGWREADILAMSPRRRQRYLDLLPT